MATSLYGEAWNAISLISFVGLYVSLVVQSWVVLAGAVLLFNEVAEMLIGRSH